MSPQTAWFAPAQLCYTTSFIHSNRLDAYYSSVLNAFSPDFKMLWYIDTNSFCYVLCSDYYLSSATILNRK